MAPKRKELSLSEKNAIAALHKAGMKGPDIARQTRHPLPTIYGVLNRFKGRGSLENKERTGRPNLLTPRDTRKLCTTVKSDRKRPLHEITAFNESREEPVSKRTVQRKLYEEGFKKRVVKKSIRIRAANVKKGWHGVNWPGTKLWKIIGEGSYIVMNVRWKLEWIIVF
ncbi:unnamed protein product [Mytilus edulis]|uniref:Transposase Tc1-like domain-containing protein n=1 Tax=Mytilus edulis TaxID=6550 RepID=A0A8S3RC55_MYTED|nr:unnamed protein product [Mytilus edulis]